MGFSSDANLDFVRAVLDLSVVAEASFPQDSVRLLICSCQNRAIFTL